MGIDIGDVEYVANLSRLRLSEDEKRKFTGQLAAILGYIDKLNELDTSDVEPMAHASVAHNVFREDENPKSLPRDEALANAPDKLDGFFRVPKVIE